MLTILLALILASVSALSVFGASAAGSSENREEIKDKATSAFQEFLDTYPDNDMKEQSFIILTEKIPLLTEKNIQPAISSTKFVTPQKK